MLILNTTYEFHLSLFMKSVSHKHGVSNPSTQTSRLKIFCARAKQETVMGTEFILLVNVDLNLHIFL